MKNHPFQVRQGDILIIEMVETDDAEGDAARRGQLTEIHSEQGALVIAVGESSGHRHQVTGHGAKLFARGSVATLLEVTANGGAVLEVTSDRGEPLPNLRHGAVTLPKGRYKIVRQREWDASRNRFVED